ncbi:MAG: FkbM family methyltransferase [Nitrososphaerota archaeon]|nr:FkbM family methyltransferase [Nitrososphaerota archaeon]
MLPEEVEIKLGDSRFVFRPKIDGLWYFDYSLAEPGVEKVIRENLKKGYTFVDVGAHIGYYSILARNIVGECGKVVAFEPNPKSYNMLKKNIELNGFKNCIPENLSLSDVSGVFKLYIGKYAEDSSSLFQADEVDEDEYVNINAITFDEYSELHGIVPDLVKIDAEGAEYKVLRGMRKTIDAYRPSLVIEVHPRHLEKQGISLDLLFQFLRDAGYEIYLVKEYGAEATSIDELVDACNKGRKNKYGTLINQHILCKVLRNDGQSARHSRGCRQSSK